MRQIENSRKSGAGTDDVYSPKLWCFDELSFLNDGGITRTSQSNIDPDSNKAVEEHNDHESRRSRLARIPGVGLKLFLREPFIYRILESLSVSFCAHSLHGASR
ncbi:hypothetical protein O3P69_011859 [Scylla paramamosain]|uniref:Uncharacterized protein n=1 Tax=Scylla paramamosain TaxID=85552 RepID=A0AAW0SC58_SCYPA